MAKKPHPPTESTVPVSLDATPWRMLRRALKAHPASILFADIRGWGRRQHEVAHLRRLCGLGLLMLVKPGPDGKSDESEYAITPAGIAAADMGECQVPLSVFRAWAEPQLSL